jgi:hypothetical protein
MKMSWDRFGARLGIGICLLGFVLIFVGWNGAASSDRLPSQFPYLISGGLGGLGLIIVGAALIVVQTGREDRELMRSELADLRAALEHAGGPSKNGRTKDVEVPVARGQFVRGETTYHLPSCRLLEGRGELASVGREQIAKLGLVACRVCKPPPVSDIGTGTKTRNSARGT